MKGVNLRTLGFQPDISVCANTLVWIEIFLICESKLMGSSMGEIIMREVTVQNIRYAYTKKTTVRVKILCWRCLKMKSISVTVPTLLHFNSDSCYYQFPNETSNCAVPFNICQIGNSIRCVTSELVHVQLRKRMYATLRTMYDTI